LTVKEEIPERRLGKEVVGTTFKVYLHLLKVKQASARQVYRDLEMSSPWLATYHLDKLHHLKLARKDIEGIYHVNPRRFGILRFFVVTGKWIIPRTLFYTLFFVAMAVYLLRSLPETWNIVTFALALIAVIINVVETIWFYKTLLRT
jgi:hypothetical protein